MPVIWKAVGASILPTIGGIVNGQLLKEDIETWYGTLKKPRWCPPNNAYPFVWTGLYTGMGYASYLVWRDGKGFNGPACLPLTLYASQLALNWSWSPIFFHFRSLKWSTVNVAFLWSTVAACGYSFWQINKTAGLIMIPYLGWLTFAFALNYRIWKDNPQEKDPKTLG